MIVQPPQSAMVFAAGFGTRMGALTESCPKPLLRLDAHTLLDHTLDLVSAAGIGKAVVNLHYRGQQIRDHLAGRAQPAIVFSDEQPEILDTGGGIVNALGQLGPGPFATINADTVFLGRNPLALLGDAWQRDAWQGIDADALLLLVPVANTVAYTRSGDFFLDTPTAKPHRRGQAPKAPYVYAGAQIIRASAFDQEPEGPFSLNIIWDRLLAKGRVRAAIYPDRWVDVGTPDGLALARDAVAAARV